MLSTLDGTSEFVMTNRYPEPQLEALIMVEIKRAAVLIVHSF